MIHITFALIVISGIVCATYLAMNGHYWFALLVIITISGVSMRSKG